MTTTPDSIPTRTPSDQHGPVVLETAHGYDLWAASYDVDGNPLVALETIHLPPLLPTLHGLRVLDVGCGTGRHALSLAGQGATVTGVDFSEGMLRVARDKPGAASVRWVCHDLGVALPFNDSDFDLAVCALVLDHVPDVEGFFSRVRRVCRSGAPMVVSVMHPAMMLRGVQARFHDESTGREIRPRSAPNQLSDYVIGAQRAGWRIEHLGEHAADEALAARFPRAARYVGWPMLVTMRLSG